MAIKYPLEYSLGQLKVQSFPKVQYAKIVEIIDALNGITDGTYAIANFSTTTLTATTATIDTEYVGLKVTKPTSVAINATATATAAQIVSGYITSTSAAATSITTPTATAIGALIGATRGTQFDLVIDNSAGANTVTLVLDASISVNTPAITGGATLTVSTANSIGTFRIIFTSTTAAKIFRIA